MGYLGFNFTLLTGCYFNFNYNHRLFWAHLDISSGNPERPFNVTHRRCHLLTSWSFGSLEKQGAAELWLPCGEKTKKKAGQTERGDNMEIQVSHRIHVFGIFTYVWWIFVMVNVGKIIPYMDGLGLICWKECQTKCN